MDHFAGTFITDLYEHLPGGDDAVKLFGQIHALEVVDAGHMALSLFVAFVDGATTVAPGSAGGTSSNLAWGKDPREEERTPRALLRYRQQQGQRNQPLPLLPIVRIA